jgi:hypothetical protein
MILVAVKSHRRTGSPGVEKSSPGVEVSQPNGSTPSELFSNPASYIVSPLILSAGLGGHSFVAFAPSP